MTDTHNQPNDSGQAVILEMKHNHNFTIPVEWRELDGGGEKITRVSVLRCVCGTEQRR